MFQDLLGINEPDRGMSLFSGPRECRLSLVTIVISVLVSEKECSCEGFYFAVGTEKYKK